MERCNLGAFITNLGKFNEGEIIGEWISFPIKQEEFQKVLDRIGINENYEEYFFSDYDTNISGISDALGEHANADELNYLAARLQQIDLICLLIYLMKKIMEDTSFRKAAGLIVGKSKTYWIILIMKPMDVMRVLTREVPLRNADM